MSCMIIKETISTTNFFWISACFVNANIFYFLRIMVRQLTTHLWESTNVILIYYISNFFYLRVFNYKINLNHFWAHKYKSFIRFGKGARKKFRYYDIILNKRFCYISYHHLYSRKVDIRNISWFYVRF
jgi:hypothetical protein